MSPALRMALVLTLSMLALAAGGCRRTQPAPGHVPEQPALAPLDAGASLEERERAIVSRLQNGGALELPEIATEPGQGFDYQLVDKVAPRPPLPTLRMGATTVNGRLPAEVIQRIVRQNFGRFRLCYENALREAPDLAGSVVIDFVIDPKGRVTSSKVSTESTLPDEGMRSCVARGMGNLSFPQPEGGVVKVTYPVTFALGPAD